MKPKSKIAPRLAKHQYKVDGEADRHRETRRRIWMRLMVIFLATAFIASECAILLPVE